MRTMHWRERIHSATLWTAHDCGPFWLRILMHCVFKYIWAKGPKTWLYRGQTPCSGLRNQNRPWRRRKRWNLKISCVRWRHVLPFMKALPFSFSDQPYLPGKHKRKPGERQGAEGATPNIKAAFNWGWEAKDFSSPPYKDRPPARSISRDQPPGRCPPGPPSYRYANQGRKQNQARTGTPQFQTGYLGTPLAIRKKMRILSNSQIYPSMNRLSHLPPKD